MKRALIGLSIAGIARRSNAFTLADIYNHRMISSLSAGIAIAGHSQPKWLMAMARPH